MIEEKVEFGKVVYDSFRLRELQDEYQPETKYVLDLSETEYVSREVARELLSCNMAMNLSEPVARMMEVVDNG